MKALKIIKINLLAIVSIILFIVSSFFKVVSITLSKLEVILKIVVGWVAVILGLSMLLDAGIREQFGQMALAMFALVVMLGLVFLITYLIIHFVIALLYGIFVGVLTTFAELMDMISFKCLSGYMYLKGINQIEYQIIGLSGNSKANDALCMFFTIQKGIEWGLSYVFSKAILIGMLFIGGFVTWVYMMINAAYVSEKGMTFIQYWLLQPKNEMYLEFSVFISIFVTGGVILFNLVKELADWGKMLRNEETSGVLIKQAYEEVSFKQKKDNRIEVEKAQEYYRILCKHLQSFRDLENKVSIILAMKEDVLLNVKFQDYCSDMMDVCKYIDDKGQIRLEKFKLCYTKISNLDAKRIDILELANKLEEKFSQPFATSIYFGGCNTKEKLDARYKQLCKAFHPDSVGGDTELFQKMKQEYELLKSKLEV